MRQGTVGPLVALPLATRFGYTVEYLLCAVLVVVTAALVLVALVVEGTSTVDKRLVSADD
ncbi:hypothetical protein [Halococcus salsus]|uniref:hypothetical protein n=1 Tax=Halococcus salsus TaxID=2162894 RepID=UPI001F04E21E|nr:hypothetical protein [Halococcus salsus]